jgi:hypothetical protein
VSETRAIDRWRFLPPRLVQLLEARLDAAPPATEIPFTPFARPLSAARIALLSTAGISCLPDPPFDMEGERINPMWGDPSWRRILATASAATVAVNHLHIDTRGRRICRSGVRITPGALISRWLHAARRARGETIPA